MDGFETAARLRALGGPAGATPIVALTANADEATRARCLTSGMQDVVAKPVDPRALLDAISRCVWMPSLAAVPQAARELPQTSGAPVLCPDRLSLLRETMPEAAIGRMFEACLTDLNAKVPPLQAALAESDTKSATQELHAMSGVAASYGLAALEGSLRVLQAALNRGDRVDAAAISAGIGRDLARAEAAVRNAFASEPVS